MADSAQKEAFRKYLEASGVIDAMTKGRMVLQLHLLALCCCRCSSPECRAAVAVLVSLYEEPDKPKQAIEYVDSMSGLPLAATAVIASR